MKHISLVMSTNIANRLSRAYCVIFLLCGTTLAMCTLHFLFSSGKFLVVYPPVRELFLNDDHHSRILTVPVFLAVSLGLSMSLRGDKSTLKCVIASIFSQKKYFPRKSFLFPALQFCLRSKLHFCSLVSLGSTVSHFSMKV